jgi:hypothetical protein
MFSLDELASNIEACRNGRMSLDDFEDWFRDNSRGAYQSELKEAYFSVEEVFSKERRGMSEELVVEELAVAIRPFAWGPVYAPAREIVVGKPPVEARSANRSFQWVYAVA